MNLHELRGQLNKTSYTLLLSLVMLLMIYIGYQLAYLHHDYVRQQLSQARTTVANYAAENNRLTRSVNEHKARLEIAELANEALDQRIQQGLKRERQMTEQVTFYQKVIAPELSEDGFSIDGVQIASTSIQHNYILSLVLIQQTRIKSTISGSLKVTLSGSKAGQPHTITLPQDTNENKLRYSFKYFQTLELSFDLPPDFIPEQVEISTSIYQFRKKRGDYTRTLEWSSVSENT